jgi:CRP-like cAMP-binding protein
VAKAGEVVCRPGEEFDGLYVVITGSVALSRAGSEGTVVLLGERGAGIVRRALIYLCGGAGTSNTRAVRRNASAGRFVRAGTAQRHPESTITQQV